MSLDKQFEEMVDKAVSEKLTATPPDTSTAEKKKTTYTKILVTAITGWAMALITFSYILAWFQVSEIGETLSGKLVACLVVVPFGYLCKSYFETKAEEEVKLERDKMEREDGSPTKEDNVAG